jgi:hypothetical protein
VTGDSFFQAMPDDVRIPGGCDDCNAHVVFDHSRAPIYILRVYHDLTCPWFRQHLRAEETTPWRRHTVLRALVATPLPGGQGVVLVTKPDQVGRQPPLHCPTKRRSLAPAIGVAATLTVARIVNPLQETACHGTTVCLGRSRLHTTAGRPGRPRKGGGCAADWLGL